MTVAPDLKHVHEPHVLKLLKDILRGEDASPAPTRRGLENIAADTALPRKPSGWFESLLCLVFEEGTDEYTYFTKMMQPFTYDARSGRYGGKPTAVMVEQVVNTETGVLAARVRLTPAQLERLSDTVLGRTDE